MKYLLTQEEMKTLTIEQIKNLIKEHIDFDYTSSPEDNKHSFGSSSFSNYKKKYKAIFIFKSELSPMSTWSVEVEGFDKQEALRNAIHKYETKTHKYPTSKDVSIKMKYIGLAD